MRGLRRFVAAAVSLSLVILSPGLAPYEALAGTLGPAPRGAPVHALQLGTWASRAPLAIAARRLAPAPAASVWSRPPIPAGPRRRPTPARQDPETPAPRHW